MIQANEIRLGNWFKIGAIYSRIERIEYGENDFEPIPLTPEILIKAGFEKDKTTLANVYRKEDCRFWLQYETWNPIKIGIWKKGAMDYGCYLCNVGNLHDLQNLYVCLTGTELEIRL